MKRSLMALCGILLLGLVGTNRARADELTFLSTQLRPLEEAQRARTEILKNAPIAVTYVPEEPPQLLIHLQADAQGAHTISLVAALHGELAPLVSLLQPLDAQKDLLAQHEVPSDIVRLAHLGSDHLMYVPWMQATYIMAANKKALQYLPPGAKLDALSYAQLAQWRRMPRRRPDSVCSDFPPARPD